jgi:ribosomal protein L37AE/L43A
MFVNFRKTPYEVLLYEALINRLPKYHRLIPELTTEVKKRRAGFRGEKELDHYLGIPPRTKYTIACDLRLENSGTHFQIDSLVITPNFTLIIEVKDWEGTIKYDPETNQILQIKGKTINRYDDPILQAKRQKIRLDGWLRKYKCKLAPIEVLVVMSNKDAVLVFDSKNETTENIIYIDAVLERLENMDKTHKTKNTTSKEINESTKLFLENRSYKKIDVFKKFNISQKDITTGVQCPDCNKFKLERKRRTWYCPDCKIHSADAHINAIHEYLLIHSTITNKQCREFLGLKPHQYQLVSSFLKNMKLPFTGTTRNRIYYLST